MSGPDMPLWQFSAPYCVWLQESACAVIQLVNSGGLFVYSEHRVIVGQLGCGREPHSIYVSSFEAAQIIMNSRNIFRWHDPPKQ